jgi:hypothetical protein
MNENTGIRDLKVMKSAAGYLFRERNNRRGWNSNAYDRKGDYFEYVRDGRKSTRGNESIKETAPIGSSAGAVYARKKKTGVFS